MTAGYSGKPLSQKLGIKPGMRMFVINPPKNYGEIIGALPEGVSRSKTLKGPFDLIHLFASSAKELHKQFFRAKESLASNGALWISWPKGSSGLQTDLNETGVRQFGLEGGLVDIKICAVDEKWSGLKFVYRLKDRK